MKHINHFVLIIVFCLCMNHLVYAATHTPLNTYLEIKDGIHVVYKIFEMENDINPSELKENTFELDGFSYNYYDTEKEEITNTETKQVTETATVKTDDNNVTQVLQHFDLQMDYTDEDSFTGILYLEHASVKTEVEGYTTKTYTLKDNMTVISLSNNDPSNIPKTMVKEGVTLNLQNVDWNVNTSEAVDYNEIPTSYTATAYYSGSYTKQVPTGYVSTVQYSGEVTKTEIEKVKYTVTYLGTEIIPEPVMNEELNNSNDIRAFTHLWIVGLFIGLFIIVAAGIWFIIIYPNIQVYLKNNEDYQLIARKHINLSNPNPTIDLVKYEVQGKEVAIRVKKHTANKLFGRHIRTIAGGNYQNRCLIDKQGSDFWYVVNIPDETTAL